MKRIVKEMWFFFGIGIIFSLFLIRLHFGVEITDEAFYGTLTFRILQGNIPIYGMWEPPQTSVILIAPIVWLFRMITGGMEGLQLLLRYIYLFITVLVSVPLYYFLKRYLSRKESVLIAVFFMIYAPFSIYSCSYNNIVDAFGILVTTVLLLGYYKQKSFFFVLGGLFSAVMAFSYPTQVLTCIIFALYLPCAMYVLSGDLKMSFKRMVQFIAGGLGAAAVILTGLLIWCTPSGIMEGISGILSDPAYGNTKTILDMLYGFGKSFLYLFSPFCSWPIWVFIASLIAAWKLQKKYSIVLVALSFLLPFTALAGAYKMPFYTHIVTHIPGNSMLMYALMFPFIFFFIKKNRDIMKTIMFLQYIPAFFIYFVIANTSAGEGQQAIQCLVIAALATLEGFCLLLKEWGKSKKVSRVSCYVFLFTALLASLTIFYDVVYRDARVKELKVKMESGPFSGLYTTEEAKTYYDNTYKNLRRLSEDGKSVCVLYHANFVYPMLDNMRPCTPNSWGLYSGYNNEYSFLKYFYEVEMPEIIFVVDMDEGYEKELPEIGSIYYKTFSPALSKFVGRHYRLEREIAGDNMADVKKYRLREDMSHTAAFYEDGISIRETDDTGTYRWCSSNSKITVKRIISDSEVLTLKFLAKLPDAKQGDAVTVTVGDVSKQFDVIDGTAAVDFEFTANEKEQDIMISCSGMPLKVDGDARELVFQMYDFSLRTEDNRSVCLVQR